MLEVFHLLQISVLRGGRFSCHDAVLWTGPNEKQHWWWIFRRVWQWAYGHLHYDGMMRQHYWGPVYTTDHEVGPWKMVFFIGPTTWSNFHGSISYKIDLQSFWAPH